MRRGRSTPSPSRTDQARFDAIHRAGCVACRKEGRVTPAEIHHLTVGGRHGQKRRGHRYTIGLCAFHHRGMPQDGMTRAECEGVIGPSYALTPKRFRECYGSDDELLAYQDRLIEALG
jgi:hypothetical protein